VKATVHYYIEIPFSLPPGFAIVLDHAGHPRLRYEQGNATKATVFGLESALHDLAQVVIAEHGVRTAVLS
jgi:hypothetical protein